MTEERIARIADAVVRAVRSSSEDKKAGFGLKEARRLILGVEKKAKAMGLNVVVAVSNSQGRMIAVECMDNSYIASYDVAVNKAFTVTALKMSTKKLSTLAAPGGSLYGIQFTNGGRIVIFGGGDPLVYNGEIIGGIGVSGGSEEEDTLLSAYGAGLLDDIMNNIRKGE